MNIRKELLEIPEALRQMTEDGLPLYDALVRRVHWVEKPIFMLGNGPAYAAALSGAWAFESLLGIPVVARRPAAFSAYTSRALARHSLAIVVDSGNDLEETLAAAQQAHSRGAIVWAVTANAAGELAASADAVVNDFSGESGTGGSRSIFCQHAALTILALAAARVLKAPGKQLSAQEEELGRLAGHVKWVLDQTADAARALAEETKSLSGLVVTGGGPFYPAALQAAGRLRQAVGIQATGLDLLEFRQSFQALSQPGTGVLYLSSSRCALKAQVHQSASEAKQKGKQKILAVTDGNDRQLSERADLAVLLPILTETCGALLSLVFVELAASFASRSPRPASTLPRRVTRS